MFYWFEPVLYLDPVSKFQYSETTERLEYFVGFSDNVGVLHRRVVRSVADTYYHLSQMHKKYLIF
jgi:hypothetical protein